MAKSLSTKEKISESLLDMLEEKNIDDITVGELIEFAAVSRSTFYRNFHDVYDVYDNMLENFAKKCMTYFELILESKVSLSDIQENVTLDWHMKNGNFFTEEDYKLFSQVVYSPVSTMVLNKLYLAFYKLLKDYLMNMGLKEDKADFYSDFILESLLSLYSYALKNNNKFNTEILESALRIIENCKQGVI